MLSAVPDEPLAIIAFGKVTFRLLRKGASIFQNSGICSKARIQKQKGNEEIKHGR